MAVEVLGPTVEMTGCEGDDSQHERSNSIKGRASILSKQKSDL